MGRQPCCLEGVKKGPWSADEDRKLIAFITSNGHGCWREVPKRAGLQRCGKSCRLRWMNYLRPDLKRGVMSMEEEALIIQLHASLGNKWSRIAAQLPGRTDNEIKNCWNTRIKKKLREMGIDPVSHRHIPHYPVFTVRPPAGLQAVGSMNHNQRVSRRPIAVHASPSAMATAYPNFFDTQTLRNPHSYMYNNMNMAKGMNIFQGDLAGLLHTRSANGHGPGTLSRRTSASPASSKQEEELSNYSNAEPHDYSSSSKMHKSHPILACQFNNGVLDAPHLQSLCNVDEHEPMMQSASQQLLYKPEQPSPSTSLLSSSLHMHENVTYMHNARHSSQSAAMNQPELNQLTYMQNAHNSSQSAAMNQRELNQFQIPGASSKFLAFHVSDNASLESMEGYQQEGDPPSCVMISSNGGLTETGNKGNGQDIHTQKDGLQLDIMEPSVSSAIYELTKEESELSESFQNDKSRSLSASEGTTSFAAGPSWSSMMSETFLSDAFEGISTAEALSHLLEEAQNESADLGHASATDSSLTDGGLPWSSNTEHSLLF
ncbi:hypothetical protein KP509_27G052300 [Ceratopteris richardii]|uniref:Uncharacterized protein n=1 Tax=Ceratopteris richardii TaxID=49495 RepID=A0A8T2RG89_CERRI|nr:hypothetical protein KP509_27G052300 [Ceratopteris richardii]